MAGYFCLEIAKDGSILSISSPENYSREQILPTNAQNILDCWDEETNKELQNHIKTVFSTPYPLDFTAKNKHVTYQFIGNRISDNKALIYVKPPVVNRAVLENEWSKLIQFSYENSGTCIFFVNEDATFYEFNEIACSMHGYSREEMLKMNVFDLNPFFTKEMWNIGWKGLEVKSASAIETKHRKKDGTIIDVIVNNNLIQFGNKRLLCGYVTDITEKKKIEERLHLVDFAFKKTAVSIFIIKEDASFYEFNEAALDLYGYTPEEMKNLTVSDLTIASEREKFPMEWAKLWVNLKEQKTITFNSKHQKKDGAEIDVEVRVNYINFNGIELNCAFVLDISDAKKTEEALRKSIERYEYATIAASDVIWEADFIENTYYLSKNYTTHFGHPSGIYEELYDNEWIRNIHPDDFKNAMETAQSAINNGENTWVNEYRLKKSTGEYANVIDKAFVLRDGDGTVIKFMGSLNDVTLKKVAERERENLIKELLITNNELKQFSYITTHNLRAPLTNLLSICSLLNTNSIADPKTIKLIEGFKSSTFHLNETLNDLIGILIIKENTSLVITENDLKSVLDKVLASISALVKSKNAKIEVDFAEASTVMFNRPYLESVFLNLLTNALKYSHPERTPIIKIKANKDGDGSIKLLFSDNGIGMNMKIVKEKIFGLYQKFHSNSDGKGIGLYLIHSEITAMGGSIEVDSEVNVGTTFTINFKS